MTTKIHTIEKKNLRPYQNAAVKSVKKLYQSGKSSRQLITLPTGGGKTLVMGAIIEWIFSEYGLKTIMLAHRDELLDQAQEEFEDISNDFIIEKEKAESKASPMANIIVASVQSIGQTNSPRIKKFNPKDFGLILVDECHHSTSTTYRNAINYFKEGNPNILLVGVTATPFRSDKEDLSEVFDTVAHHEPVIKMMRDKWLTPTVSRRILSRTSLKGIKTTAGDYNIGDLSQAVNNLDRNKLITETYLNDYNGKSCVVFATDLEHAETLTKCFHNVGVPSAFISGSTPKNERSQIITDFKAGRIKVLTNYAILTEGFNYKELELIIVARPTQSLGLLTQMVGRVYRLSPETNKDLSTVIEIVDLHSDKTATTAQIFNFNKIFDCEGHSFLECCNVADSMIQKKDGFTAYQSKSWSDMHKRFDLMNKYQEIEDSYVKDKEAEEPLENDGVLREPGGAFSSEEHKYRFYKLNEDTYRLILRIKEEGSKYNFHISRNAIGQWTFTLAKKPYDAGFSESPEIMVQKKFHHLKDALRSAQDTILDYFPDMDNLLNLNAPWRLQAKRLPCSDKQYELIAKNKLSKLPREQINKALASDLISALFNR